jgi:hypothetical protein
MECDGGTFWANGDLFIVLVEVQNNQVWSVIEIAHSP